MMAVFNYRRMKPPKTIPTTAPRTEPTDRGAPFWSPGSLLPVASAEGTTSTHEVEVKVVIPPSSRVEVNVLGTALDVRLVPVPVTVRRSDSVSVAVSLADSSVVCVASSVWVSVSWSVIKLAHVSSQMVRVVFWSQRGSS